MLGRVSSNAVDAGGEYYTVSKLTSKCAATRSFASIDSIPSLSTDAANDASNSGPTEQVDQLS